MLLRTVLLATMTAAASALSACDSGTPGGAPDAAAEDSATAPPPVAWRTLAEHGSDRPATGPVPFRSSADSLRVITELTEARSPFSAGVVVTNLLAEHMIPITSIRAEQARMDTATSDTQFVDVPPGPLYLFVAEHRGLARWRVVVQERVRENAKVDGGSDDGSPQ